jgi:RsiW-degrading membrane proteinase PrsW (M82 family)
MEMLIAILLALFGAIIPTLFYINLIWWLDRYEREPIWLLALAFLWGALPAVIVVLVPEVIFDNVLYSVLGKNRIADALSFGFSPPFFEESAKGVFLVGLLLSFWKHVDDALDGIIYGAMVGFGFAMTEDLVYFFGAYSHGGVGGELFNIFMRTVVFGMNHAFFTSWTGLGLGWARMHHGILHRVAAPVLGWLAAMFFHSVHNLGATFAGETLCVSFLIALMTDWGGILLMTFIAFWLIGHEHQWLVSELQPEVASGLLTQQEYHILISSVRRAQVRFSALLNHGWRAYQRLGQIFATATDLAFTKHQLREFGEERGNTAEIVRLRERLAALRAVNSQQ